MEERTINRISSIFLHILKNLLIHGPPNLLPNYYEKWTCLIHSMLLKLNIAIIREVIIQISEIKIPINKHCIRAVSKSMHVILNNGSTSIACCIVCEMSQTSQSICRKTTLHHQQK